MRVIPGVVASLALAGLEEGHAETGKDGNCLLQFRGFKNKIAASDVAQPTDLRAEGTPETPQVLLQISVPTQVNTTNSTQQNEAVHSVTATSSLVGLVGFGMVTAAWYAAAGLPPGDEATEGRNVLVDNCKVLALFMVIYASFITSNMNGEFHDTATWLKGAEPWLSDFLRAGSMIVVPLICFLSGVCSQGPVTAQRIRRYLQNLVVPTILWTCVIKPVTLDTLMNPSLVRLQENWEALITLQAFQAEWYLQALVLWRGSTFLMWSHMRPSVAFLSMLAVSCIGGYHHYNQASGEWMHIDEALGFLPYFAMGYAIPFEHFQKAITPSSPTAPIVVILCWIVVGALALFSGAPLPEGRGWYGCCEAGETFAGLVGAEWEEDHQLYFMRRLAKVTLDAVPMLLLVFLVVPRSNTPISWMGAQTLYPFLFHPLVWAWLDQALKYAQLPVVESKLGHSCVLTLLIPVALCIQYLLASPLSQWCWSWCFDASWLLSPFLAVIKEEKPQLLALPKHGMGLEKAEALEGLRWHSDESPSTTPGPSLGNSPSLASIAASNDSMDELPSTSRGSCRWLPKKDIIGMKEAREFYPYLLPLFLAAVVLQLLAIAITGPQVVGPVLALVPLSLGGLVVVAINIPLAVQFGYHVHRLWRTDRPPAAPPVWAGSALVHVVVVVEYKEPVEVLARTVETIAQQSGIAVRPMVVMATESRDEGRFATCEALKAQCGSRISRFMMTEHTLQEGETVGKHSNENVAVHEVYRQLVEQEGMDPFEVMMTVVDADSLLSTSYLAHVEAAFHKQLDGRRLVYSGPLNTYRNFADAGLLVQMYEIMRCNTDTFHDPLKCYYPQSNYSLSLGFIAELGYWSIDTMPEDVHTAAKAMVNNFGSLSTVAIPALICNDLVENYGDRYTQAKRHQWGITEMAWHFALAKHMNLSFSSWWAVFGAENRRAGSFFSCAQIFASFIVFPSAGVYAALYWDTLHSNIQAYVFIYLATMVFQWIIFWAQEFFLWRHLLHQFPIEHPSPLRWLVLALFSPVWHVLTTLSFFVVPTIHCLYHVTFIGELGYVCAPKGEAQKTEGAEENK